MKGRLLTTTPSITTRNLHNLFDPQADIAFNRQVFSQHMELSELFVSDLLSFGCWDHVIIACEANDPSLNVLLNVVRDIKSHLPIVVLVNGDHPDLLAAFQDASFGNVYSFEVADIQNSLEQARHAIVSSSGSFYGQENAVIDLGATVKLDRLRRQIYRTDGFVIKTSPTQFKILEYLALRFDEVIPMQDVWNFLYGHYEVPPVGDKLVSSELSNLIKILTDYEDVHLLRRAHHIPYGYVSLSQYPDYFDLVAEKHAQDVERLRHPSGFVSRDADGYRVLRVGGLIFHSNYPTLNVDGQFISLRRQEFLALSALLKTSFDFVLARGSLEHVVREFKKTDKYDHKTSLEHSILSRLRKNLGDYGVIIPSARKGPNVTAEYYICRETCRRLDKEYSSRQAMDVNSAVDGQPSVYKG